MLAHSFCQEALKNELARRASKNFRYSLRAFARDLGVSPSYLSMVIKKQRVLSPKAAMQLSRKLGLKSSERLQFVQSSLLPASSQKKTRQLPGGRARSAVTIEMDRFEALADWYHMAILELTRLKGFRNNPKWIARKLGVSAQEASAAVERLLRVGLLEIDESSGKLSMGCQWVSVYPKKSSLAVRSYHRQVLALAAASLDRSPIELREFGSMVIAIDPKQIASAKKKIISFRQRLSEQMSKGNPSELYYLSMQLFPVGGKKE